MSVPTIPVRFGKLRRIHYTLTAAPALMGHGEVRFIEVKGRVKAAKTVTITKNEILTCLNKPEQFILAIVVVDEDQPIGKYYLRRPFNQVPDFGVTSVNYDLEELISKGQSPS